jgi:hypothetical protein
LLATHHYANPDGDSHGYGYGYIDCNSYGHGAGRHPNCNPNAKWESWAGG